ncbi:MAG: AI-2E family transporter [Clostridia bacterium]|nr:AI-2E family transporter [Clostridia bacterium]
MTEGKLEKYAAACILAAFAAFGAGVVLKYLLPALFPVLAGYGLAAGVRAMGRWIRRFTGGRDLHPVGERIGGMALAAAVCVLVVWGIWHGMTALASQAGELVSRAADLWRWEVLPDWVRERVPEHLQQQIGGALTALVEKAAGVLASAAGGIVTSLPGAALAVFLTLASLFYWLADREGILAGLRSLLSPGLRDRICRHPFWTGTAAVLRQSGASIGGYLRAQVSLVLVLFFGLTAGLSLLGIRAPAAWGCLIALADLLPFFGAGAVLLPWAGIAFLTSQTALGVGIGLLWLVLWLLRQWLEPRLVGNALGVHPYIMLAGLYAAYRLGGVGGMLAGAVLLGGLGGRQGGGDG